MSTRPEPNNLIGQAAPQVPMSCQRIFKTINPVAIEWIGPEQAAALSEDEQTAYNLAHTIIRHTAVQAPVKHQSGHPGGPLSAFTFSYWVHKLRDPTVDQPYRMSAGHLSVLGFTLQYLFGRDGGDARLSSPQGIIDTFRTPAGLPGHIEAGLGDIPFGTGPLGKGLSHALGTAFGLKYLKKPGWVDVLLADGDSQEGQVMEAVRLAAHLELDNLVVHGDWNDIQLSGLPTKTVAADFSAMLAAAGWRVIEVQNGNDPAQVKAALNKANEYAGDKRPIFICYFTTMGSGISFMEAASNDATKNFHGAPLSADEAEQALAELADLEATVTAYEPYYQAEKERFSAGAVATDLPLDWRLDNYERGIMTDKGAARKEFGALHVLNLMKIDPRIIVLHADLAGSGGFNKVEAALPERCLNVGVAEANMYMMAAGMRQVGLLPLTYTFAAFGTNEARANARLIDVNCGHTRCGIFNDCTHAGLSVGEDGETHQERNYLNIPLDHTQVWMTADSNQAGAMAERGFELVAEGHQSVYAFFPRSGHEQLKTPAGDLIYGLDYQFDGRIDLIRGAGDLTDNVTVIATGIAVHDAVAAADELLAGAEKIAVRVLNVACVRPIDSAAIIKAALETSHLLVVEDHHSEGGLASQVADIIADFALPCSLRRLGVNRYMPSGTANELKFMAGLDAASITDAILDEVRAEVCGGEDALVTALSGLKHNARHSRFAPTLIPYLKQLQDAAYLEALRKHWAEKECPKEKLPSNEELVEGLEDVVVG